ncbi:MAG: hypothetical protein DMG79_08140 [Acidobacteria bacterium]|nr:MAG: hypothetical protein DMG79_08140 [Acidobacteriota bacterium]
MERETNHSEGPSTLPEPQLNPLLNPVLGQNMGRWAEVYFTSPPEKREQAVLDLLRDLQGENPARVDATAPPPSPARDERPESGPSARLAQPEQAMAVCPFCGRENPASHRFCGMCGKIVAGSGSSSNVSISDLHITDMQVAEPSTDPFFERDRPSQDGFNEARRNGSQVIPAEGAAYDRGPHRDEVPLFRGIGDNDYPYERDDEIFHYPEASRSYRVYVGIALAIVLFALGYMAWRSMQSTSQNAHVESAPPPTVTEPAATAPATAPASSTPKSDTPPAANTPANSKESSAAPDNSDTGNAATRTSARKTAKAARPVSAPKNSAAGAATGNGAEEFATAQRYLNGTGGQQRNPAEAAKWLWKAIANHNSGATLLLSDLYLRGEGVGKNCDQARVLLDNAARQGVKDAGQRLRHLQAFGCQ